MLIADAAGAVDDLLRHFVTFALCAWLEKFEIDHPALAVGRINTWCEASRSKVAGRGDDFIIELRRGQDDKEVGLCCPKKYQLEMRVNILLMHMAHRSIAVLSHPRRRIFIR